VSVIGYSNLTPDDSDLQQMAKGIQAQYMNYAVDGGTVNSLNITMQPVPSYQDGLVVRVRVGQNNTGPSVINVNAKGARPIRRKGNVGLLANDLIGGSIASLIYNAVWGVFELIGVGGAGARGELVGDKALYVNYAIGNDANDGTANDAAHAVKNIQRAIDLAFSYAPSQYGIYINVSDSPNYTFWSTPGYPGPIIHIVGNITTPSAVQINGGNNHTCYVSGINTVLIQGVKVNTNASGTPGPAGGFVASQYAVLTVQNCESGTCHGAVFEASGATVYIVEKHKFTGNSGSLFWGIGSGVVGVQPYCAFTIANAITVNQSALASLGGLVLMSPQAPTFANPGNVTGYRYQSQMGGIINVNGNGPNYFPGTIPGITSNGGIYG
jgi:hypothetical protein